MSNVQIKKLYFKEKHKLNYDKILADLEFIKEQAEQFNKD